MAQQRESEGFEPAAAISARQWDALGQIRRLEDQGLTAARQVGGLHLATLKPLQTLGLILITEHDERDRKGRKWAARLTDIGRRITNRGIE
jgi:hypothetical protein